MKLSTAGFTLLTSMMLVLFMISFSLFLHLSIRTQWSMAADAYFGALEIAASQDAHTDPRLLKKLAISLYERGDHRIGIHFMRLYHARLIRLREERFVTNPALDGLLHDPGQFDAEVLSTEQQLQAWDAPY